MLIKFKEALGKYKNWIFLILVVALALKVIIPQLDDLKDSLKALKDANLYWILLGTIVYFAGIISFAVQIVVLAFKSLGFWMTYKVEMAGQFVSKLLPSFVGVFSLNMYYLIKKGHTAVQATTVMTANALASGVAYTILIILALTQSSIPNTNLKGSIDVPDNLIYLLIILLFGGGYYFYRSAILRTKLKKMWADVKANIKAYKQKPFALLVSVVYNGIGSAANIFAMYASAHAKIFAMLSSPRVLR